MRQSGRKYKTGNYNYSCPPYYISYHVLDMHVFLYILETEIQIKSLFLKHLSKIDMYFWQFIKLLAINHPAKKTCNLFHGYICMKAQHANLLLEIKS